MAKKIIDEKVSKLTFNRQSKDSLAIKFTTGVKPRLKKLGLQVTDDDAYFIEPTSPSFSRQYPTYEVLKSGIKQLRSVSSLDPQRYWPLVFRVKNNVNKYVKALFYLDKTLETKVLRDKNAARGSDSFQFERDIIDRYGFKKKESKLKLQFSSGSTVLKGTWRNILETEGIESLDLKLVESNINKSDAYGTLTVNKVKKERFIEFKNYSYTRILRGKKEFLSEQLKVSTTSSFISLMSIYNKVDPVFPVDDLESVSTSEVKKMISKMDPEDVAKLEDFYNSRITEFYNKHAAQYHKVISFLQGEGGSDGKLYGILFKDNDKKNSTGLVLIKVKELVFEWELVSAKYWGVRLKRLQLIIRRGGNIQPYVIVPNTGVVMTKEEFIERRNQIGQDSVPDSDGENVD